MNRVRVSKLTSLNFRLNNLHQFCTSPDRAEEETLSFNMHKALLTEVMFFIAGAQTQSLHMLGKHYRLATPSALQNTF